eukprot:Hpha_TRINITY_DN15876_c0_g1::TRINITY_DN15876_c0_g1_i2::g.190932::m.190932
MHSVKKQRPEIAEMAMDRCAFTDNIRNKNAVLMARIRDVVRDVGLVQVPQEQQQWAAPEQQFPPPWTPQGGHYPGWDYQSGDEVGDFIQRYSLDHRTENCLRGLPQAKALEVIANSAAVAGTARNFNAVVTANCKKAAEECGIPMVPSRRNPPPGIVD